MIELTKSEYATLHEFATTLSKFNWGMWPAPELWPNFQGIGYTVSQFTNGGILFVFNEPIRFETQKGKRWSFHIARAQMPKGACRIWPPRTNE